MLRNNVDTQIMLITKPLKIMRAGGRELLCKLNYDVLNSFFDSKLVLYELPEKQKMAKSIIGAFTHGYVDGLSEDVFRDVVDHVGHQNIGKVFVDGSNLGGIVKYIKQQLPNVEVITYFHNVEARFFLGSLKKTKTLHAFAVFLVNYLAERKAVKYSDKIVCLNERDSLLLHKIYQRKATHISAMALHDKLPTNFSVGQKASVDKFALFVGGDFYANRAGITWFVKNVSPHITIKTCIVGRGLEKFKTELERNDNVQVIGEVDSLSQWYYDAHFVIAPIFDGSGMKTKVAEALMYGKKIVGTSEAFSGYEDIASHAGWLCETAEQFVIAIENAQKEITLDFDPALRLIYEKKYSFSACKARFANILNLL